jgi:hypothetical protein
MMPRGIAGSKAATPSLRADGRACKRSSKGSQLRSLFSVRQMTARLQIGLELGLNVLAVIIIRSGYGDLMSSPDKEKAEADYSRHRRCDRYGICLLY